MKPARWRSAGAEGPAIARGIISADDALMLGRPEVAELADSHLYPCCSRDGPRDAVDLTEAVRGPLFARKSYYFLRNVSRLTEGNPSAVSEDEFIAMHLDFTLSFDSNERPICAVVA